MINFTALRKRLFLIIVILAVIGVGAFVSIKQMELIDQLKAQGKEYNVGFATVTPSNGKDGESAYDIAKRRGFSGSEEEWLASLVSKPGNGLSAYQIAVVQGFTGSQEEWLASLKGEKGDSVKGDKGDKGDSLTGSDGLTPPCYHEPSQCRGADGQSIKGDPGTNGTDGQPPTSWRFTYLTTEYECKRAESFDPANPTYTCDQISNERRKI